MKNEIKNVIETVQHKLEVMHKTYAPTIVKGYVPPKEGAKTGKWLAINNESELKSSFNEITLLRIECDKFDRVLKVRDNREAIREKLAVFLEIKRMPVEQAVYLACKDFPENATKWIPKEPINVATSAVSNWGKPEGSV